MTIASDLDRLARLTLVACDASYAGRNLGVGTPLAAYPDATPGSPDYALPGTVLPPQGFSCAGSVEIQESGFKLVAFTNASTRELMFAFAGTDGLNWIDWAANLELGWKQWMSDGLGAFESLYTTLARQFTPSAIHFTGQSLGGALAEYAALDFADKNPTKKSITTLTTFNGLGSIDGLAFYGGRPRAETHAFSGLGSIAHFYVRNDLVSRLGGGHLGDGNGTTYELPFVDATVGRLGSTFRLLDPLEAHRIESGFYKQFAISGHGFELASRKPLAGIDTTRIQPLAGSVVALFNSKGQTETSAQLRLNAAVIKAMNDVTDPRDIQPVVGAVAKSLYDADLLDAQSYQYIAGTGVDTLRRLAGSLEGRAVRMMLTALVLEKAGIHGPPTQEDIENLAALSGVSGVQDVNASAFYLSPDHGSHLSRVASGVELIDPDSNAYDRTLVESLGFDPDRVRQAMVGQTNWVRGVLNVLSGVALVPEKGVPLLGVGLSLAIRSWAKAVREKGVAVSPLLAEMSGALNDLAEGVANQNPELIRKYTDPNAFSFDWGTNSPSYYRDLIGEFQSALHRPDVDGALRAPLADALAVVEKAGQLVVLKPGRQANPFDTPGFAAENAVSTAPLNEGQVRTFTAYLPYAAGKGGQRIRFRIAGAAIAKLQVLRDADPVSLNSAGEFDLVVPEGAREVAFGVHARQDVDVDETLGMSATLVDAQGNATHQTHLEVNVSLDASLEPATSPSNVVSGTAQDDNRLGDASHRPVSGTAGGDRLVALAGRDELYAMEGDDVLESGAGNDIADGGAGADRVFADVALDEAQLRGYIDTTAVIADATHAGASQAISSAEWLRGGLGDDTVVGGTTPDILFGGGGSDLIVGGAGHDIINGDDDYEPGDITTVTAARNYGGNPFEVFYASAIIHDFAMDVGAGDEIHGGSGDDVVMALSGDDTVFGDAGDDSISGDEGSDSLFGGAGSDRIVGESYEIAGRVRAGMPSDDYIDGGDGNDTLYGETGADVLVGGTGNDKLRGNDDLAGDNRMSESAADDGDDHLSGGAGEDELIGDSGDDTLLGGDGNDQLFGDSDQTPTLNAGNDDLDGGAGADYLRGYAGNDTLLGGAEGDSLIGEEGDDELDGGTDDDTLWGGDGDDTLRGWTGLDRLVAGAGDDRLNGGIEADQLWGEAGSDQLDGDAGDDYLDGGDGDDTLNGGSGFDRLYGLAGKDVLDGGADTDYLLGGADDDDLRGGDGDDGLWGEAGADLQDGGAGADWLYGGLGNDTLRGGDGIDVLLGEDGDDTLSGGAGVDWLEGGAGNDLYLIDPGTGEDVIVDNQGQNTLRFTDEISADELRFRSGRDLAGNDRYLVVEGPGAMGRVVVSGGLDGAIQRYEFADGSALTHADVIARLTAQADPATRLVTPPASTARQGTSANDILTVSLGSETVHGLAGDDTVTGGKGDDTLHGDEGDDTLDGGAGNDNLVGGVGQDTYVFGRGSGRDSIQEALISKVGSTELDTVVLGPGVAPADVSLQRDNVDLVLAIGQTQAQLRVSGHFLATERVFNPVSSRYEQWPSDHRIERIRFADGTAWDAAAIAARTVAGSANAMTGTAADDTFTVDDADDAVIEAPGGGTDTIRASVSYALPPNVERLTLTGFIDTKAWAQPGNAISYLTGNNGNNTFNGPGVFIDVNGQFVQTLTGGTMGYAVMAGGPGDDRYYLWDGKGGQVSELPGEGDDTVVLTGADWIDYTLPANVENLRTEEGGRSPSVSVRHRSGNALANYIEGFQQSNISNVIDGGAGADTMVGFYGDDTFIVDDPDDRILDRGTFADGGQASQKDEARAGVSYVLPDNVDVLTLTGSAAIDGWGNDLPNTLSGVENSAVNRLAGGLGDDYYKVGANDIVLERPGEGIDIVEYNGTGVRLYTPADLPANIEGIALGEDLARSGYEGDGRDDRVSGNSDNNPLSGGSGHDQLAGGAGDDVLDGGAGNDWLRGGSGFDIYRFSRGFGVDVVSDTASNLIEFDATIAPDQVSFRDGYLTLVGTSDRILLDYSVGIRFADGTAIDNAEVINRLAASYSSSATNGADTLTGTAGANTLDALGGNDYVRGEAGADVLAGGTGNDQLWGGDGADTVTGGADSDKLWGGRDDDTLDGGDGSDAVYGEDGNDTVRGGADFDQVYGHAGDDDLDAGDGNDFANGGSGNDRVAGGGAADTLYGGEGNDVLSGDGTGGVSPSDGDDALYGEQGDDTLQGGGGADTLSGGTGVDTYVLQQGGGIDVVDDPSGSAELTIVQIDSAFSPADLTLSREQGEFGSSWLQLRAGVGGDGLDLGAFGDDAHPLEIRFGDGTVWSAATVQDLLYTRRGSESDDTLVGSIWNDRLYGLGGNDTLQGLEGDDLLDGGVGADTMDGGNGSDVYLVDTGDVVSEVADNNGFDRVETAISYVLPTEIEDLLLTGSSAVNGTGNALFNHITGNAAANVLDGKGYVDVMAGGAGDDTYIVDNTLDVIVENANEGIDSVQSGVVYTLGAEVENLTLIGTAAISGTGNALANALRGNAAKNTLTGLAGNDTLDGGAGADVLKGGAGDDTYVVDNSGDAVTELSGDGSDVVRSSVTFTLAAEVEKLVLTGTAAVNGTGNALANTIDGNAAANVLDGKAGGDTLKGGAGNDTYVVDSTLDAVIENAAEGTDTIQAAVSWTLGANFENLTLTGAAAINATGNTLANTLQGNSAANILDGGAGNDTMRGGAGNDTYLVDGTSDVVSENVIEGTDVVQAAVAWTLGANLENLTLTGTAAINGTGNTLDNALFGNAAANTLEGGAGADTMAGGGGDDTYVVDSTIDAVSEASGAGSDLVRSAVNWTLGANVEHLTLTGTSALTGTGNGLANTITGNAAANVLDGGEGNDTLDGQAGADTLRGGTGNDVLVVDNLADVVVENAGEGDDTVRATSSWTLGANVENLTLTGAAAISGTGNALDNWIQGNAAGNALVGGDGMDSLFADAGNDMLDGGAGHDLLQGGDGDDTITDASGNSLLHGGAGIDVLAGGAGNELFAGGSGNDTLDLGLGADIIAFNRGDGQDRVNATTGADNALSLGGGIRYADVTLSKSGSDLIVGSGAGDQITLKDWYLSAANRHVVNLQMVIDASSDWNAASPDPLKNKRIEQFNFAGLVSRFDALLVSNPGLTGWGIAGALADFAVSGSDTAAFGGDLAYQHGHGNGFAGIGMAPADAVLASASFGVAAQALQSSAVLFNGVKPLH